MVSLIHESDPARRREVLLQAFRRRYACSPEFGARSPGRVDLMGSHTDYNEGAVLTLTISRETWIVASPRPDRLVRVFSLNLDEAIEFPLDASPASVGWAAYVHGVAEELRRAGYPVCGFDGMLHGTVPLGSGLSSSASLETAVITLFEMIGNYQIDPLEKARIAQRAEHRWAGVQCGLLDQYSCVFGEQHQALALDCRTLTHTYASVPPGLRVVIGNTCAPRQLSGSEYGERRARCEEAARYFTGLDSSMRTLRDVPLDFFAAHAGGLSDTTARRARFIIEEHARVATLAEALARDDLDAVGRITAASFAGARDLFEITVPAMEAMYDALRQAPGCVGCRQAGGGFGGCLTAFFDRNTEEEGRRIAAETYTAATGITPDIFPVHTAAGAGPLDLNGA